MKKEGMIPFLVIILLLSITIVSQAKDLKVKVIVENANVRLEPDLGSQIIAKVPLGTVLQSEGKTGEWHLVILPADEKGFVVSGYIHQSVLEEIVEEIKEVPKVKEEKPKAAPPLPPEVYVPKRVEKESRLGIGIRGGYAMPSEEKYGGGLEYGGNFSFIIIKYVAIELSGLRFQTNVEGDPEELSKGKLSAMPIQLSIQARFPINGKFAPYILGGGGYYLNSFSIDAGITDDWNDLGFDVEEKVENTIGFHFGAGIDLFFTKNIALNADFRYCLAKVEGSWSLTDQVGGTEASGELKDLSLNTIMFGVGMKFCF